MENGLRFRSDGLTSAIGNFPMGMVLIEKDVSRGEDGRQNGTTERETLNTSIMSDDILRFAKREAARIREMRKQV